MDRSTDSIPGQQQDGSAADGAVILISHLAEARGAIVRGHGRRVAAMVNCVASMCGLPEDIVPQLRRAALLHDIGKANLPQEVFEKPYSHLAARERLLFETHPRAGAALVRDFLHDAKASEWIAAHHEAYDGSGYPGKMSGADIPLAARVLSACSRLDHHLIDEREATARPLEDALDLLKKDGGARLDPQVTEKIVDTATEWLPDAIKDHILLPPEALQPDMLLAADVTNVSGVRSLRAGTKIYQKLIEKLQKDKAIDSVATGIAILFDSLPRTGSVGHRRPSQSEKTASAKVSLEEKPKRPLVVVVDDEANVVNALNRELRSAGYRVKTFTKSLDALFYIRDERGERGSDDIFALITDFNMPGMRGDNLLHSVQQEFPDLPCIVLTGLATKDTVISLAKAARIRKIISKPWDKTLLLEVLAGIEG